MKETYVFTLLLRFVIFARLSAPPKCCFGLYCVVISQKTIFNLASFLNILYILSDGKLYLIELSIGVKQEAPQESKPPLRQLSEQYYLTILCVILSVGELLANCN